MPVMRLLPAPAIKIQGSDLGVRLPAGKYSQSLPEWPGSYSTLGVFYYQTGQYAKAREVLDRFKGSHSRSGLDVSRIEQALANAPQTSASTPQPLPMAARQQLLQVAFSLADRTL